MSRSPAPFVLALAAGLAGCAPDGPDAATAGEPAPPRLEFAARELPTGVRLHYAVQGDSGGPAVILLHGYSDSWYSFSPILPLLPAEYRVYSVSQRGHGESGKPDSGYAMPELAADILALMDAEGIGRAVVVGHSFGNFVAQHVASAAPERVAGLVLIGAARAYGDFDAAGLDEAVASFTDSVPAEFVREFQVSTIHRPVADSFLARVIEESRRLTPAVWQGVMRGMLASEPQQRLATAGIPTLLIWGDRDAIVPRAAQDSLLALIPGSELRVYEGTGHAVHWEEPARVAAELMRFLRRELSTLVDVRRRAPV